jgi:uncharacterized SAM-binding protein YcdF (DUF218 family)
LEALNLKFKKSLFYICILSLIFFLSLQFLVVKNQNTVANASADAIVILGHSLEDGVIPSEWLEKRLYTGLELYNLGYSNKIIVTGGVGLTDTMPVAISMQTWLVENGVPIESVVAETYANNTFQNFKLSKYIAKKYNIESIIVVTNDFHMYRSLMIANNFFDDVQGHSANIPFSFRKFLAYLKEPLSIIKYFTFHKFFS